MLICHNKSYILPDRANTRCLSQLTKQYYHVYIKFWKNYNFQYFYSLIYYFGITFQKYIFLNLFKSFIGNAAFIVLVGRKISFEGDKRGETYRRSGSNTFALFWWLLFFQKSSSFEYSASRKLIKMWCNNSSAQKGILL